MKKENSSSPLGGKEHWERKYEPTAPSENMKKTKGADFNPKCADDRKTTHIKVNKEDH